MSRSSSLRAVAWPVAGVGFITLAFASCTVDEIDLNGKGCPCAPGWHCNDALRICLPGPEDAGDAKIDGKGGTGGKIEGGTFGGGTGGTTGGAAGSISTGATGGVAGSTPTGGGGIGATGATGGVSGTGGCTSTQKICNGNCVSKSSPTYGCSSTSCDACPSTFVNAHAACSGGQCAMACDTGYGNCDTNTENGCEVQLNAGDGLNCGACGRSCSSANAVSASCSGANCNTVCQPNWGNCDETSEPNPDNGCESNLLTDATNCGSCTHSCSEQGGTSKFSVCTAGLCGCNSSTQCVGENSVNGATCNVTTHRCTCSGIPCNNGEVCVKDTGNTARCACNGGLACPAGQNCCPSGCTTGLCT